MARMILERSIGSEKHGRSDEPIVEARGTTGFLELWGKIQKIAASKATVGGQRRRGEYWGLCGARDGSRASSKILEASRRQITRR